MRMNWVKYNGGKYLGVGFADLHEFQGAREKSVSVFRPGL